jgi:hypothetical protein
VKDAALWFNDLILFGTGVLVLRYVVATNKLVRASQRQVEGQSLPAIVVKEKGDKIELVNIGSGPALKIEWRFKDRGTPAVFVEPKDPIESLSFSKRGKNLPRTWSQGRSSNGNCIACIAVFREPGTSPSVHLLTTGFLPLPSTRKP